MLFATFSKVAEIFVLFLFFLFQVGGEKDIFTKMAEDGIWCGFKRKTVVMTCIGRGTVVLTCAGRRNRCYDLHR